MKQVTDLREWQIKAIELGRPSQYFLCQAPGGSGKSLAQVMLAAADVKDTGNKQLILVPQSHIHHGFFDRDHISFTLPGDSGESIWIVKSNLCDDRDGKVAKLKRFLLGDVNQLRQHDGLTAISTHKAMIACWSKMNAAERRDALRNISFRIDEAHHISNAFDDLDLGGYSEAQRQAISDDATKLGRFVQQVLNTNDASVKLHLATATFFRGDRRVILSNTSKGKFASYYLPWDEHFKTLGIGSLRFEFNGYENDPIGLVLDAVASEPDEKHLIILPAVTRRYRTVDSHQRLMNGLHQVFSQNEVLDLVSVSTQDANKALLFTHPNRFKAVVACRLFDEGTDWVPCSRLHNTAAGEKSLTLAVQRLFRPLRKHPAKASVRIANYVPQFDPEMSAQEQRTILSDRFNAVLAAIVTFGEIQPCFVRVASREDSEKKKKISLQELYGPEYRDLLADLLKGYETVEDKKDGRAIERIVEKVMVSYGIPPGIEPDELRTALLTRVITMASPKGAAKNTMIMDSEGVDVEEIRLRGFDKVWQKVDAPRSVIAWESENITSEVMRELLGVISKVPSLAEIDEAIRRFYKAHGRRPVTTAMSPDWLDDLQITPRRLDRTMKRQYRTTFSDEVKRVLGDPDDQLIERCRGLIDQYATKGIRLGDKYGYIPEVKMSAMALGARLKRVHGKTLSKLAEEMLGKRAKTLEIGTVRQVVAKYLRQGTRLHRKFGHIPELGMTSFNLADRLKRSFGVTLTGLVDEVQCRSGLKRTTRSTAAG